jgi:hypothetical protein
MKWNRDEVIDLLRAEIDEESKEDGKAISVYFEDETMGYMLLLIESANVAILLADPHTPLQALPNLELSLPCTELAPHEREGLPIGLGIYDGPPGASTLRLFITRREDGGISISGASPGVPYPLPEKWKP